jgi:hypothetical protein
MEVNEGCWGRSDGQIGSMKVRCKSTWLLHCPVRLAQQLDKSSVRPVVARSGLIKIAVWSCLYGLVKVSSLHSMIVRMG